MLKEGSKFNWESEYEEAFSTLKITLRSNSLLQCLGSVKESVLTTDASTETLCVLLLEQTDQYHMQVEY